MTNATFSQRSGVWSLRAQSQAANAGTWGDRAIFCIGEQDSDGIDFFNITSLGNSRNFGNLSVSRTSSLSSFSSYTRAVFCGGLVSSTTSNVMDFVTIASTGNAVDFGDMDNAGRFGAGYSSKTRGINHSGFDGNYLNRIEYVTIASTGNGTDFGDDTLARNYVEGLCSTTRGIAYGGNNSGANIINNISYITIASTGNATDFGDLLSATREISGGASSGTRGVMAGGVTSTESSTGNPQNVIQYITIASTGDATDFGDLIAANKMMGGTDNQVRGVFTNGHNNSSHLNTLEFITIATTGNGTDFGDSTTASYGSTATSDSHGGLTNA